MPFQLFLSHLPAASSVALSLGPSSLATLSSCVFLSSSFLFSRARTHARTRGKWRPLHDSTHSHLLLWKLALRGKPPFFFFLALLSCFFFLLPPLSAAPTEDGAGDKRMGARPLHLSKDPRVLGHAPIFVPSFFVSLRFLFPLSVSVFWRLSLDALSVCWIVRTTRRKQRLQRDSSSSHRSGPTRRTKDVALQGM